MAEQKKTKESRSLRFLYNTAIGRIILKPIASRTFSKIMGRFMDSRLSKPMIKRFVKKNGIILDDFYSDNFKCFNDCFTRKIKEDKRPIEMDKSTFISPCDSLLSAYTIDEDTRLNIKYMEPLTLEYIAKIIRYERPDAILPGIGGQTHLTTRMPYIRQTYNLPS